MRLQGKTRSAKMTLSNTISVRGQNTIRVQDDDGGIGSDILKLQQQTETYLQEKKQKALIEAQEALEELKTTEQDKQRDGDKRNAEKFEYIDPHPLYCVGRYAINLSQNNQIQRIESVDQETLRFKLARDDSKIRQSNHLGYDDYVMLSKVFFVKISMLEAIPQQLQEHLGSNMNHPESHVVVIQKLTYGRDDNQVDFITPISNKNGAFQAINIKIKEQTNFQRDLRDFDSDLLGSQLKSGYTRDATSKIGELSNLVQKAFSKYFDEVKAISLKKENLSSLLFSIVSYEPISNEKNYQKQKLGIYLRAKYDPHFQDYMIFIRLLSYKSAQKERTEWFQLSKFSIRADLTRGFVSLEQLQLMENISNSQQKLKIRMFEMISYQESKLQQRVLRDITDIQDHSESVRPANITKEAKDERCSTCNYITNDIEHLKCSNCSKNYHLQCLKLPNIHSGLGIRELEWLCQDCIRCTNCLSTRNKEQMLICKKCNAGFHFDCLDQSVKLAVPSIVMEKDQKLIGVQETKKTTFSQLNNHYKCEQCAKCENCNSKEAGEKRINKWSKDYKLCSICNKKRQNKQYCLVCEKFWPDISNPGSEAQLQIIQCNSCEMQVHQDCDRIFLNPNALHQFQDRKLSYKCKNCRQKFRLQYVSELIEKLAQEDKMYFYQDPVEGRVQNYTKIIKNPMCFKYVREKVQDYLRSPELLKSDVNLIFQNAITFNQPKHRVHKDAIRMKDICNNILSRYWGIIEKNKLRCLDEDSHQQRVLDQIQVEKVGRIYRPKPDEQVFMLPIEDLLDPQEHTVSFQQSKNYASSQIGNQLQRIVDQDMTESDNDQNFIAKLPRDGKALEGDIESDDQNPSIGGNDPHNLLGLRDSNQIGGITKNLRQRKQINYNEDRLLASGTGILAQISNDISLSGSKRSHNQAFKQVSNFYEEPNAATTVGGNSIKSLKRLRQNQQKLDPDFIPPGTLQQIRPQQSGASLLTQALNQDSSFLNSESNDRVETKTEVAPVDHIKQQQQMMMSYYQEIDDEKCYYSNPARCSFDDPSLLFEEMCYLCGSFGDRKDFLSCTLCGESFHTYCLQLPEDDISKYQKYWKCLNCKFCEICASATQEAFLLYCDVCDKAFHSFCLKPQLKSIPNCQWKCQECFKCQQCGTKEFFSSKDTEEKKNLDVTDFEFSQNFSFCYQCGKNEYKKSFCKICQKKVEDLDSEQKQDNGSSRKKQQSIHHHSLTLSRNQSKIKKKTIEDLMLKCSDCGFYSHYKCSKLLPSQLNDPKDFEQSPNQEALKDYKCLECLLAGKTINHLIRETCEEYENIHQIISRHKLLGTLCFEILHKYFPIPEKAPLFIKSFVNQNFDFFRKDQSILDWLDLLECNVCLETADQTAQESLNGIQQEHESQIDININQADTLMNEETKADVLQRNTGNLNAEEQKESMKNSYEEQNQSKKDSISLKSFGFDEALKKFDKNQQPQPHLTEAQKIYHEMYGYKESFLPDKRNLYSSLNQSNLHRFGLKNLYMNPSELAKMITTPTDEILNQVNFSELYVRYELKAVMKIKFQFFKWFEEQIKQILRNNSKLFKKDNEQSIDTKNKQINDASEDFQIRNEFEQINTLSQINHQTSEDDLLTIEDSLVANPQMKLQCILCKNFGEYTVTGRLIPFQVNQFVHVNCAVWSTDVFEIGDGQLVNFFFVQNGKARTTKCIICNETGATIICFTKKCNAAFHFPCAYRENRVAFLRTKETYCDMCTKGRDFQVGYLQEFTTKRRFQICRNQIPWNMSIMYQPPPGQQINPFYQNTQLMALHQTQVMLNDYQSPSDLEKPLQIEKWRPFYFDMFNRVGNLTVLSLKKEINQIIQEIIHGPKKETNLDNQTDFAAIRIYWKFYKDQEMEMQEDDNLDPINVKKSFYMYSNNTIRQILKNDLHSLLNFASEKIREKISIGIHYNQNKNIDIKQNESSIIAINQTIFWQKIMHHFQRERPNFTLQNIIFSISEFGGKTKYPISVWNRAEIKNKGFFLKSGSQVLHQQNQNQDRESQSLFAATKKFQGRTIDDVFKRMIKINQMGENQNPMTSMKRLTCSKHMKYENMLQTLGKKMFYTKSHQEELNENKNQQKEVLAKKIRLTDTIDTNKEIDLPIAMKYRLSKAQPKRVEVGPSKIHRNGLFTHEDLMPGDIVIEYVGEKIRNKVADKREIYYEQKGIGDCYLFRLDKEYIIDATFFGNKARYLNHSCDANCSAKIINVQQQKHIIISTNRQIKSGEELTYNYNFDYETNKIECFCGAPTCSGRLN